MNAKNYLGNWLRKLRQSKNALFISLLALMLMGCASSMTQSRDAPPIPASSLLPCQDLEPLPNAISRTLLQAFLDLAQLYHECQDGKQALIDAIDINGQ